MRAVHAPTGGRQGATMRQTSLLMILMLIAAPWIACDGGDDDDDDSVADDDDSSTDDDDDDSVADDDDDDSEIPELAGPCSLDQKIGYMQVQHEAEASWVYGEFANAVVPVTILEQVEEMGECRLMRRNNPFCDPPCDPGYTCDFDGTCIPYPEPRDVGTITIDGLLSDVEMPPSQYWDTEVPNPPFEPGVKITMTASGGDYSPAPLYGQGLTPLELPDETWIVRGGQPLEVHWTAASESHAQIRLQFNIDQHGVTPLTLYCDLPDTGSYEVPAEIIDDLMANGVTGFPSGKVFRQTVDSTEVTDGCIEFVIYSFAMGDLQVEGHIPCDDPDDCPEGMECDFDTNTCV